MKLSVITVCKNSEAHIEQAIQSVLAQTYRDVEYIVIDGQSSDRTLEIVKRYGDRLTKIISEPDTGIYEAMNKGIRLSSGDFLYFMNSDDYLVDEHIFQDVVDFIARQPQCDFLYGNLEVRLANGQKVVQTPCQPARLQEAMMYYSEGPQQPSCFFGRRAFERIGLFGETYRIAADYEWFIRMAVEPSLTACYFPRLIGSFATNGVSNTQPRKALEEVFYAQSKIPLYQTETWLYKRLERYQQAIIELHETVRHLQSLQAAPALSTSPSQPAKRPRQLRKRLNELLAEQRRSPLTTAAQPAPNSQSVLMAEVHRLHQQYLEFQTRYTQHVADELQKMHLAIADLQQQIASHKTDS